MARSPIARSGFRGDRSAASLQENMELLTGQRGDGLDRALTLRDMVSLGVLGVQRNGNGSVIPKPLPPVTPDGGVVEMPHAPKGFRGMGGFGAIMLEWANPTFKGYAHTEVWRAAPLANQAKPSIGEAVLIATTPATVFGDIVKPGSTFYYWIRFINLNDIPGPYNGVDGVKVSTSPDISDIIDDVGEQMKDSELIQDLNKGIEGVTAAVQENTKVIEKLNTDGSKAYQSMWNVKAQAGDIKAGIGILADSNGKSQVAVAASQFFVFDPNVEGGETKPLFAIDKGNVIIPKAYIETATIQILNAQTIVADEVKAGISIKSPVIEGGSVTGGWAGFGPGGRFNGWRTYINASGQIFTDGINAVNGSYAGHLYATSGEMHHVLIHESCEVRGLFYAENMIGDVYDQHYNWQTYKKPQKAPDYLTHVGAYVVLHRVQVRYARRFPRLINVEGAGCHVTAFTSSGASLARMRPEYWLQGRFLGFGVERYVSAGMDNIRIGTEAVSQIEVPVNASGTLEIRLVMTQQVNGLRPSVFTHATGASFDSFQVTPVKASIWKKSTDLG
ncbi:phage tail tip fiber protein [Photobacterium damselae]|uniref:phage tail tip fiber protein n=1 Tax=Photobacterium damselae TaxID=38293 RepID=UPI000DF8E313|nr:DUF1983 domain-containing protein [Photobacterium damselae]SUB90131.1 Domain of uncharacterised function (DUF1983) [Photobacterium damselae]